jgi:hypothetical protein
MAQISSRGSKTKARNALQFMSDVELANLGDGEVAYIKVLTSAQAKKMFPQIEGLPRGINLFSLHGADGTPIALTDTIQAAVGHAMEDELAIASVH